MTCENVRFGKKHDKPAQVRLAFVPQALRAGGKVSTSLPLRRANQPQSGISGGLRRWPGLPIDTLMNLRADRAGQPALALLGFPFRP
jgi:hypothetical protein